MDSAAMTVQDVATYLNVDAKTVYRLTKHGFLPGFKVAGTWRFKRSDIDMWIEEQKVRRVRKAQVGASSQRRARPQIRQGTASSRGK